MLAGYLLRTLERHADRLTDDLVTDLTTNVRTPSFRRLQVEALRESARAIYGHLVEWLEQSSEARIEATFEALGRERFDEQIPLEELVYAIILTRQHVRDSIGRVGDIDAAIELHYVIDLHALVALFFDRALHATVKGYEQARREPPDVERQRQKAKFGITTSDGIKMSADLGGWVP